MTENIGFSSIEEISDNVPAKDKLDLPYLKGNVDWNIANLIQDKIVEKKAYDRYLGIRDSTHMQHLADNYGVGTPSEIPSMKLMKRRVDALVGKMLQNDLDYEVSTNNEEGILLKMEEKKTKILEEIEKDMIEKVKSMESNKNAKPLNDQLLKKLKQKYNNTWRASFEETAKDYTEYFKVKYDLKEQFKEAGKDLCITGQMYNRVWVEEEGTDPKHMICDPRDVFYEKNPNSPFIEDCRRVVHRMYLSPVELLNRFGHLMEERDRGIVGRAIAGYYNERYQREQLFVTGRYGEEIQVTNTPRYEADLIEVFHVEWIANDLVEADTSVVDWVDSKVKNVRTKNKRHIQNRYEGYMAQIGGGVYFGLGKSKFIQRSVQDPYKCKLTYNGIVLGESRNFFERPYSIMILSEDLSDIYDLTYFHLNNLMASARPGGAIIPVEYIPKEFGNTPEERLLKFTGYLKTLSVMPISLSQEGNEGEYAFNNFGNYNSNLDGNLIQAFVSYLDVLEQQADRLVGLNQRVLGEVEERDGKAVTQQAITQSEIITKELFFLHSTFIRKTLEKIVNTSRMSYHKKPLLASYSMGDNYKIFQIEPEKYSLSDFNIHFTDNAEDTRIKAEVSQLAQLAIQNQMGTLKDAFEMLTAKSIGQKRTVVNNLVAEQEEGITKQLEEAMQQNEQLTKELETLNKKIKDNAELDKIIKQKEIEIKEGKLNLERQKHKDEIELEEDKIEKKKETDDKKIDIEKLQLFDNTKRNDKVNWNK